MSCFIKAYKCWGGGGEEKKKKLKLVAKYE